VDLTNSTNNSLFLLFPLILPACTPPPLKLTRIVVPKHAKFAMVRSQRINPLFFSVHGNSMAKLWHAIEPLNLRPPLQMWLPQKTSPSACSDWCPIWDQSMEVIIFISASITIPQRLQAMSRTIAALHCHYGINTSRVHIIAWILSERITRKLH